MANIDIAKALDRLEYNSKHHRAWDVDVRPVADFWDEMGITPEASRDKVYSGALHAVASWKSAMTASGTVGTAPEFGVLLKAAAMLETIVAVTSVTYAPNPTFANTGITVDCYKGNAYKCSVASAMVRELTLDFEPNKPVVMGWDLFGNYAAPSDAVGSAVIETALGTMQICKGLTCTIAGLTARVKKAKITLKNTLGGEPDLDIAGTNGVMDPQIGDRTITWEATVRLPSVATLNLWTTNIVANAALSLAIAGGSGAGNLFSIACGGFINDTPDYGGDVFHEITIKCRENMSSRLSLAFT